MSQESPKKPRRSHLAFVLLLSVLIVAGLLFYKRVTADPLATLDMLPTGGMTGVLLGDFNGDGKTDIVRWSDTPSQNRLYTSKGDGSFLLASNFTITAQNLFKSDGCYYAIAADFNGDGVTDILRIMRATSNTNTSCGTQTNL